MIRNKPSIDCKTLQTSPKSCTFGLLKNKRKNQDEVHLFSINPYAEWKTGFSNWIIENKSHLEGRLAFSIDHKQSEHWGNIYSRLIKKKATMALFKLSVQPNKFWFNNSKFLFQTHQCELTWPYWPFTALKNPQNCQF